MYKKQKHLKKQLIFSQKQTAQPPYLGMLKIAFENRVPMAVPHKVGQNLRE